VPSGSPGPSAAPPAGDVATLIAYASLHFDLAEQALRNGDFARYGTEIALVRQALTKLQTLTGGATPSGVPSLGSPAPVASPPAANPSPSPAP
jgi:hypothetical protein